MTSEALTERLSYRDSLPACVSDECGPAFELSRLQSFVDGDEDIFDILSRQSRRYKNDPGLQRAVDTTLSVLENAKAVIKNQSERIEKLEDMRIHDELTGLLNQKGLCYALKREIARAKRQPSKNNVFISIQLDNLLTIENQYGAHAAKMALKLLAFSLEQEARESDLTARVEDDEFALLFVDTTPDHAIERIQDLNMRLNKLSFTWQSEDINLFVSLSIKKCDANSGLNSFLPSADNDAHGPVFTLRGGMTR